MHTNANIEPRPTYRGQIVSGRTLPWEGTQPVKRRWEPIRRCECGRTYHQDEGCPSCGDDTGDTWAARMGGGDGEEH